MWISFLIVILIVKFDGLLQNALMMPQHAFKILVKRHNTYIHIYIYIYHNAFDHYHRKAYEFRSLLSMMIELTLSLYCCWPSSSKGLWIFEHNDRSPYEHIWVFDHHHPKAYDFIRVLNIMIEILWIFSQTPYEFIGVLIITIKSHINS